MSNLNSKFQVLAGLPPIDRSALLVDIKQKAGESPVLSEGMIVKIENEAGTPVVTKLTSAAVGAFPEGEPWLVIEGMDQGDAAVANKCTCIRIKSGVVWRVAATGLTIGALVRANGGAIAALTGAKEQAVGLIVGVNSTDSTVDVSTP